MSTNGTDDQRSPSFIGTLLAPAGLLVCVALRVYLIQSLTEPGAIGRFVCLMGRFTGEQKWSGDGPTPSASRP
jgi:hypothetical protein